MPCFILVYLYRGVGHILVEGAVGRQLVSVAAGHGLGAVAVVFNRNIGRVKAMYWTVVVAVISPIMVFLVV